MRTTITSAVLIVIGLLGPGTPGVGAARAQSIQAIIAETQRSSGDARRAELVRWIPTDYWRVALASSPNVPTSAVDEIERVLAAYTLMVIASGEIGPLAGVTWTPEETIRATAVLRDRGGAEHRPLPAERIAPDAKSLATFIKPLLASIMGPMGENMHMVFFPARNAAGDAIAHARTEGSFSLQIADRTYRWRLPLGSLMPQKVCPVDDEAMDGSWRFCPWHGKELVSRP
jgi:hypothetical protein